MKGPLSILCLLVGACAQSQTADLAIRGATIVNVTDGSLASDQTVLVEGNRIVGVGPADAVRVPDAAYVVEAGGAYLIPGLWDAHIHSVGCDWEFPLFLAWGVTAVRNMNDGTGDTSLELMNSVKRRLAVGELKGPRLIASGPSVDGDPPLLSRNPVVVRTEEEARAAVNALVEGGADFIKVYENLSREAYFAILDQARRRGIPVDGHVPFRVTPEEAAEAGQRTVEHPEALAAGCSTDAGAVRERFARVISESDDLPYEKRMVIQLRLARAFYDTRDPAACVSALESYRRNDVALSADLLVYHHIVQAEQILADTARMRLVPEFIRRSWENELDELESETTREVQSILRPMPPLELENVRLAHQAGVVLLAASDIDFPLSVAGLSLHEELVRLVEAGLTPLEALQAATVNPAHVLGMADSLGTIEPGKLADLILLDANPLENIRNTQRLRVVIANGRLYRQAELERLVADAEALAPKDQQPQ